MNIVDRFIKYVKIDTQSDGHSVQHPTTQTQVEFARMLVEEMREIGIADAKMDEYANVTGTIPGNTDKELPVIGFLAHMDTASDFSGKDVKPRIIENYQGGDIVLNEELGIVMRTEQFESLNRQVGQDLIVTDGTTLLGGDDKAGIAAIMSMAEKLIHNPELKHGTIKIGFTPDEEVGGGIDLFNVKEFGADYAYTLDGGGVGGIDFETFNAATAVVKIHGFSIHPGSSKNRMKNATEIGMDFHSLLPVEQRPQYTEGYEGFYHLTEFNGGIETAEMVYIVRDHDRKFFEAKKELMKNAAEYINKKYGEGTLEISLTDSYYNMREMIEPCIEIVENAREVMREMGITPYTAAVRGGTDGSRLSFMGLPCPNLFTGGYNCHGQYEYVCIQEMEQSMEVIVRLATRGA